jgi:hypothetical protein
MKYPAVRRYMGLRARYAEEDCPRCDDPGSGMWLDTHHKAWICTRCKRASRYHLHKASRNYQGNPYQGSSNDNQRAECATLEEARALQLKLSRRNGVGWRIYDADTLEEVAGPI